MNCFQIWLRTDLFIKLIANKGTDQLYFLLTQKKQTPKKDLIISYRGFYIVKILVYNPTFLFFHQASRLMMTSETTDTYTQFGIGTGSPAA